MRELEKSEIHEMKRKEWIGDALLSLLSRERMVDWDSSSRQHVWRLSGNNLMGKIAKKIGLAPVDYITEHLPGATHPAKHYANALEIKLCDVYEREGLPAAKTWFEENIFNVYQGMSEKDITHYETKKQI